MDTEVEVVTENGVTYTLQRTTEVGWLGEEVRLTVSANIQQLRGISTQPDFVPKRGYVSWRAMDGDKTVFIESSFFWLRLEVNRYFKEQTVEEVLSHCAEVLSSLKKQATELRRQGRPVDRLDALIKEADGEVSQLKWSRPDLSKALSALNAAKNWLDRILNSPVEALIQTLVDTYGGVHFRNMQVLHRLEELEIRSGGAIEATPEEWLLKEWYPCALDGKEKVSAILNADLAITLDDLQPRAKREDPAIEWAPETLEFTDRGDKVTSRSVIYEYREVDGERIPAGHVTMSQREYGSLKEIPKLPHDIRLFITLTVDGREVVTGEAGSDLDGRVAKMKKGKRRGEAGGALRDRSMQAAAPPPPPWLVRR